MNMVTFIIILSSALVLLSKCTAESEITENKKTSVDSSSHDTSTYNTSDSGLATMAFIQCKYFVKERLKSPSTADFPYFDHSLTNLGNSTYIVTSFVTAHNSFGAKIKNDYNCKIRFNGGDDAYPENWQLLGLVFIN